MANPVLLTGTQNSAAISSGTSATVTSTGSVTAGNLMVVVMLVGGASQPTAFTAPDGTWTTSLATIATETSGLIAAAIFTKEATATGAFSGSFGWTTTATSGDWLFMEWAGAGAGLLDGAVASAQNASGTKTSPTITPSAGVVNDTLVCLILGGILGADTLTQPAGMTSILLVAGTVGVPFFGCASLALASASATGAKTWTVPTSEANLGVSFLIQAGPDLNLHFVGHHKAAQHTVQTGLRFNSIDTSESGPTSVVSVVNNAFVMTYYVPRSPLETSYNLYFGGDSSRSGPLQVQPETQPHFIAKPWPIQHRVLPALRSNVSADVSGPLPTQPETQPHFIGRFAPPKHAILPALRMNISADVSGPLPAQPHTPQNFVGRFTVPAFNRPSYAGNATDVPAAAVVVNAINNAFVITYNVPSAPVATRYLYHFGQAKDVPALGVQIAANPHFVPRFWNPELTVLMDLWQGGAGDLPATVDSPTHFLGRFTAPAFNRMPLLSWATDLSGPLPPQASTPPHFIARPWPISFRVLSALRQNVPLDPIVATQPETNVNFLGRFAPTHHAVLQLLRQNIAADASTATVQPETQPHFLGRFHAPTFSRFAFNLTPEDVSGFVQPETNVHFLGRFTPPTHAVLRSLRQTVAADQSTQTVQPETQPHFLAKPQPVTFKVLPLLRQAVALDPFVAPTVETNRNFLGRFAPPSHAVNPALRQNVAADQSSATAQPETNVHFAPRFHPPAHNVFRALFGNVPTDSPPIVVQEVPTYSAGRFHQPQHLVNPALRSAPAGDVPPPQPPANPHFIAKPWNVRFAPQPVNAWDSSEDGPLPPQPDTEPHFIGRFSAPQHAREAFVLAYLGGPAPPPPGPGQVASAQVVITAWSASTKVAVSGALQ